MKTITIDKAFAAALFAACEKGGRGFQAAICQETGVDSANISAMKKGKGASEEVRRAIFRAISSRLTGFPAKSYDDFIEMGRWIISGGSADNYSRANTITGTQQIAVQDCRTVTASVGMQQAGPHGTIDATLSALEYEVLTLFRKYGNAAMLERCLGQLRKAEEIFG